MKLMALQQALDDLGINLFSTNDVAKITGQNKHTINSFLARQVKAKYLCRPKKGYFSFKAIENKFLLARMFRDTYIGLHSALEYYQTTTQRFTTLDLIAKRPLRGQTIGETSVTFHTVDEKLFFGYERAPAQGGEAFVSDIEKTIIDCLYFSSKVYLSETMSFIQRFKDQVDLQKTKRYLQTIGSQVLNKRTGYLLERCGLSLEGLELNLKYDALNKKLGPEGKRDGKWKLIINEEL
jgi:predicted transcriptional regulator of viral defense system